MNIFDFLNTDRCDFCGTALIDQKTYIARSEERTGLAALSSEEPLLYDAVDCPRCGRQHIIGQRFRVHMKGVVSYAGSSDNGNNLRDVSDDYVDK